MEAKYYTPSIDEFHVGFEYETSLDGINWQERQINIYRDWIILNDSLISKCEMKTRVKHLGKSDFESLGWKLIKQGCDYSFTSERYQFVVENFVNTGTIWQIYIMQPEHTPMNLAIEWQTFGSYDTENGRLTLNVKNKSELKKLMEQLGISNWKP